MKTKFRKTYPLVASFLTLALLTGCGAKSQAVNDYSYMAAETMAAGAVADYAKEVPMMEAAYAADAEYAYEESGMSGAGNGTALTEAELSGSNMDGEGNVSEESDYSRKLIRNVDVSLQTLEFDKVNEKVKQSVKALGGYIENSSTYGGNYYGSGRRNANITARIPQDRLDGFLETALTDATVISMSENTEDITLRYSDLSSRVEALTIEYNRLTELLTQADSIESVIALESRLSDVRYEIENIKSSLKSYDNRVTYSTVYLYIEEVEIITPAKEATFGEKITKGFAEGTEEFVEGVEGFVVWFISNIFSLLLTAAIICGFVKLVQKARKGRNERPAKEKKDRKKLFGKKKKAAESAENAVIPEESSDNQ